MHGRHPPSTAKEVPNECVRSYGPKLIHGIVLSKLLQCCRVEWLKAGKSVCQNVVGKLREFRVLLHKDAQPAQSVDEGGAWRSSWFGRKSEALNVVQEQQERHEPGKRDHGAGSAVLALDNE